MKEITKYGKKMVESGLAYPPYGRVSKRVGDQMLISTGSMLDELENQIVSVPLYEPSSLDSSPEIRVHKEIYRQTSALALLQARPPFSVVESMLCEGLIIPSDRESQYSLSEIPIVSGEFGSAELADNVARALRDHKGVIIKEHGSIAKGSTLEEAYVILSSIEHACKVKYYADQAQPATEPTGQLWAPWRIEYILAEKPKGCILCDKPKENRDEENYILYRGKEGFILLNTYPYNPGHLMVAAYRHVGNLEDLNPEERREYMDLIIRGVEVLKEAFSPQGFNIGINLGRIAGAGIEDHFHTHIVPRWAGDTNYMPVVADTKVIPVALASTYETLKGVMRHKGA